MFFLAFETLIYITFIILDLATDSAGLSNILKYSGVVICFFNALYGFLRGKDIRERAVITAALFFTVCADSFLLFTRHFTIGMIFFCVTQTLYMFLLAPRNRRIGTVAAAAVGALILFAAVDTPFSVRILIAEVFYYASLFASNTYHAWKTYRRTPVRTNLLLALGLTLFVLCDISVLYRNAYEMLNLFSVIPEPTYRAAVFLSWIFYLPSQVLISFCSERYKNEPN